MSAPKGNQNAARAKIWRDAIIRAIERRNGSGTQTLDDLADKLVQEALAGEQWAMLEVGNRLEGKPIQGVEHSGPEGEAIRIAWPLAPSALDQ